jgi:hypothetical protein
MARYDTAPNIVKKRKGRLMIIKGKWRMYGDDTDTNDQ